MKILCALTQYNYGSAERGVSIEFASFLPALRHLGHEVKHFETWDPRQHPTYADLNRALLQSVDEWQPDLLFTVQRDYEIWLETLGLIAGRGRTALVTWITDDSFKFKQYSRFIGPYYDAIGTTYEYRLADYRAAGITGALYTQWAANEAWLQAPKPSSECAYPVTFIGTKYGEREAQIQQLKQSGIPITCFGHGWPNGPIATEEIPVIMRDSMISLNFSSGFRAADGHTKQLKARCFEVPGAGGFLLTETAPSLETFYRIDREIGTFDTFAELQSKLHFYLSQPELRDSMAAEGYERTRKEHLYTSRLSRLLDFAQQQMAARYTSRESVHTRRLSSVALQPLNAAERLLRAMLVRVCSLVWGSKRGTKAARRLLFEASVRLLGAKTFTSSSLPGRLFPYV